MKKWLCLALCGCALSLAACAPNPTEYKVLKIGYTHYQPMCYLDEQQGRLTGFDVEFATQVCNELGYTPEFVEIIWANKTRDLEIGTIDCIWNGMTVTEQLQQQILVSEPYLENRQVAVFPVSAQTFPSVFSLDSVAVESGGAAEVLLQNGGVQTLAMRGAATQSAALAEVLSGTAQAAVVDYTMAKCIVGKGVYAGLTIAEIENAPAEYYAVGFRKNDRELCEQVNKIIQKYKADGTLAALENKYLGERR